MNRQQAVRPLVILPGGYYVRESDLHRIHVSHRVKQWAYLAVFCALVVIGSFDGGAGW